MEVEEAPQAPRRAGGAAAAAEVRPAAAVPDPGDRGGGSPARLAVAEPAAVWEADVSLRHGAGPSELVSGVHGRGHAAGRAYPGGLGGGCAASGGGGAGVQAGRRRGPGRQCPTAAPGAAPPGAVTRPTPRRLWTYVERRLRVGKDFCAPGGGPGRAPKTAPGLGGGLGGGPGARGGGVPRGGGLWRGPAPRGRGAGRG